MHRFLPFALLLLPMVLLGCGESSSSVRPFTSDDLEAEGRVYLTEINALQRREAQDPNSLTLYASARVSRFVRAGRHSGQYITHARIGTHEMISQPGNSSVSTLEDHALPGPSSLPVYLETESGLVYDVELPLLTEPVISGLADTITVSDELHLVVESLAGFDHLTLHVRFSGDSLEQNEIVLFTEPSEATLSIPEGFEAGSVDYEAGYDEPRIHSEEMIGDTLHVVETSQIYQRYCRILPAEE